jgi:transcriptional regulator with XRE-family HTH domain
MTINDRVRQVRQTLKLTQGEFGKRIAISTSYLAGMELGDKKVNDRTIRLISMEFNISERWLRIGEGSMYNEIADINLAKLTSLFKSLSPSFQECALSQLAVLAELDKSTAK